MIRGFFRIDIDLPFTLKNVNKLESAQGVR